LLLPESKETFTLKHLSSTLSGEGSLWFESAFCKKEHEGALLFFNPMEVITLDSLSDIESFFNRLENRVDEGCYLAGWMSYEAGYAFEPSLFSTAALNAPPSPLAWFGVYREPDHFSPEEVKHIFAEGGNHAEMGLSALSFNLSSDEYTSIIRKIKEEIASGNVYQVNFTGRFRFSFSGCLSALFASLRVRQPSSYTAWLNCGEQKVLSFSPELFFQKRGSLIETMPMKGTARRGSTIEEDCRLKEALRLCPKNRAENLMIVDLLRNDLGRICRPGSVQAGRLFVAETWPTLHQMVSTIRGEVKNHIRLYDLFRALYPSGSITGAPKIKSMQIVQALEKAPRGIYTGAIGFITPERDMRFSVAIRTIELRGNNGDYGSGSGIVWDSDPEEEYQECLLKSKIVGGALQSELRLFESILWSGSYLWLDEHLDRIAASAVSLGFTYDRSLAVLLLRRLEDELRRTGKRFKVKLNLSFKGEFTASYDPVEVHDPALPVRLALAMHPTSSSDSLRYHKTTARDLYDRYYALAGQKGYDELIFINERGEVCEGAISNLFIRKGIQFFTPPLHCGLLNGIYRHYFLKTRPFAFEKLLTIDDLKKADLIYTANSVRGLRPALFSGDTICLPEL
jgi:para-aminobenzoate synthetase/4-amino-4-deoxychorismate lyase